MKKLNKKKHFLKKYKKRIRSTIEKEILLISCKDIDIFEFHGSPDMMFKCSSSNKDSIIDNSKLDSFQFSIGYASVAINLLGVCQYTTNNLVKDSYILPALYCFRIYMENSMKESILLLKQGIDKEELRSHNLISLWEMLTRYIEPDNITRNVRKLILEYEEYDPDSTAFRYSHLVNQQLGEDKGKILFSGINIEALRSSMLYIYRFLERVNEIARQTKDINE